MTNDTESLPQIFEKTFTIHTFDLDFNGITKPMVLLNFLQEGASRHAALLGYSVSDLRKKELTWVLSRYHVHIYRYPKFDEKLMLRTWPSGVNGIFALRDFELLDSNQNFISRATSSWIMLNLKSKRPIELNSFLPKFPTHGKRALLDDFSRLPQLDKADLELPFRVRMGDLDLNRHVNHTIYIQWALETIPQEVLKTRRPLDIEVGFRREAFYGNRIISRTQIIEDTSNLIFLHQLIDEKKGTELTRLRTSWK